MSNTEARLMTEEHLKAHAAEPNVEWLTADQAAGFGQQTLSRIPKGGTAIIKAISDSTILGHGECGCFYVMTPGTIQKASKANVALLRELQAIR